MCLFCVHRYRLTVSFILKFDFGKVYRFIRLIITQIHFTFFLLDQQNMFVFSHKSDGFG